MRRSDLAVMGGLFALALAVRLVFAARLVFPPLDDPAFYVQTARNLAAGRGLVSDVLWNYFVAFPSVTHPSHEFWMPLATLLMAGTIRVLGNTWFAAQLPGLLAGSLLPVLTYALGRTVWPDQRRRGWAGLAALLVTPSAILVYQSASGDSAALYAALSTATLLSAARVGTRPTVRGAMVTGVLGGLSYLTRSHGSLLIAAVGLVWLIGLRRNLKQALGLMGGLLAGALIVVGPWWLRNLAVFGAAQPFPLSAAAAARDYGEWFNYADLPSFDKLVGGGLAAALGLRVEALWHDLGVVLLITFPYGVIGLPAALRRREPVFRVFAVYAVGCWLLVSLLFPVPALTGSFYHSAGTFAPWAALGGVAVVKALADRPRARLWGAGLAAVLMALTVAQAALAWPAVWADSRANQARFAAVTQWLRANVPPGEAIITNEAHSLNYAGGFPTLTLPNREDVVTLRALADRYGARFVVVFGVIGRYPAALDEAGARAARRAELSDVRIYQLEP